MTSFKFIAKYSVAYAICTLLITLNSCSSAKKGGDEEGVIEFETSAVDKNHSLANLASGTATMKFKKEKFVVEMSVMGVFNTCIIGDNKQKSMAQTVKFMNINQACVENEHDLVLANQDYALKIEETDETKDMIGFKAYKAKVTKLKDTAVKFDVWYTKDLGMEDANILNPYAQIKGVLLDYRLTRMGIELRFVAQSYTQKAVNPKDFEISPSTKMVSKEEMAKFFDELQ